MECFKTKVILLLIILFSAVLRFFWLDHFPPSLYTDEINQGYNAYSILLTGRDEHGVFLPVSLRSFGDWKPPLSTYLVIPFIYILGLNEIAVKLPSAILGVGTIILTYYLVKELFKERKEVNLLALLASFFLSISPWHILQSRVAMLVIVGLFFLEMGIYFFIKGIKKANLLYSSSLFFAFSIYAYYGLRIITPLILLTLLFFYRERIKLCSKEIILSVVLGFIILLPLILVFKSQPDVIFGRAKTVSVFYDQGVKLRQWELITQDGVNYPPFLARFFHNNLYMYGRNIIQRFLSHFDGRYLFLNGDKVPPFQIPNMGVLYLLDAIFILVGIIILFRNSHARRNLIISWFIISILPAAFTFMTPSSNRTFNAIIPFMILVSVGVLFFLRLTSRRIIISICISLLYVISFGYFLHQYFIILPHDHADWWNYGWREAAQCVNLMEDRYNNIVVSDRGGMPYIYFLFYGKVNPAQFQKEAVRPYVEDQFGFEHVEGFDKFIFPNDWEWKYEKSNLQKNTLYVVPAEQAEGDGNFLHAIYYPNNNIKLKIFAND